MSKQNRLKQLNQLILFFVVALSSSSVFADCDLRIFAPTRVSLDNNNTARPIFLVNRRDDDDNCNYFVTISKGNSSTFNRFMRSGQDQENYNIFKTPSLQTIVKDLPDANPTEVITGSFGNNSGSFNFHTFTVFRPDQGLLPVGRYRDRVRISIFEGAFGSTTRRSDQRNIRIEHNVQPQVDISLVDSGAPFNRQDVTQTLDFGTLQSGESMQFDMVVQSNAGYEVSMSSQNNGNLQHTSQQSQRVAYTLAVDGTSRDLSSSQSAPVVVASGSGATSNNGDRKAVQVSIGSINNKLSGRYSDNITVTVTTTE